MVTGDVRPAVMAYDNDRLYLDLLGARERLCRAQTHVPRHWKSDLQVAIDHIDQAGSALCPTVWSRFNQPEYPSQNGRSDDR